MNALKDMIIVTGMLFARIMLDLSRVLVMQDIQETELIVKVCLSRNLANRTKINLPDSCYFLNGPCNY